MPKVRQCDEEHKTHGQYEQAVRVGDLVDDGRDAQSHTGRHQNDGAQAAEGGQRAVQATDEATDLGRTAAGWVRVGDDAVHIVAAGTATMLVVVVAAVDLGHMWRPLCAGHLTVRCGARVCERVVCRNVGSV